MLKARGIVEDIKELQQINDKFKKQDLWLKIPNEDKPEWSKYACFTAVQTNTALLSPVNIGDEVEISFMFDGRVWEKDGKKSLFNSLSIISIDVFTKSGKQMTVTPSMEPTQSMSVHDIGKGPADDESDDLPF